MPGGGPSGPETSRILVLRSGRHLRVAIDALSARFPGCRIGVIGTPGSEPAMEQAGIDPEDRILHRAPRFQPLAFALRRTSLAARRWRYDHVAVLWNDPEGTGQGNVNRTALVLSRRYLAIAPDGSIVERSVWPQVATECRRVIASVGVGAALGVLLYAPAAIATLVALTRGFQTALFTRVRRLLSPSSGWHAGGDPHATPQARLP